MVREQKKSAFSVSELSDVLGGSKTYLSKVMQNLVEAGYLVSKTGPGQGYSFALRPEDIIIYDIITELDEIENFNRCFFAWAECSDENPCPFHESYAGFITELLKEFKQTSLIEAEKKGWPGSLLENYSR